MKISPKLVAAFLLSAGVQAVTDSLLEAVIDLRSERTSLLEADRSYSAASAQTNLVDGATRMLAPDAVVIGSGDKLLRSPREAREMLASRPANATSRLTWTPVRVDVSADARHGYSFGYTETRHADGKRVPGKYISYWKRQPDGSWKVAVHKRIACPEGPRSHTPPEGFGTPETPAAPRFDGAAAARHAAMEADRAFAAMAQSASTAEAFRAFAAEDGAVLGGSREIVYGPEKIHQNSGPGQPGSLTWSPDMAGAADSGDLAFTTGPSEFNFPRADGTVAAGKSRYLSIWKRQASGEWRYVIDG